jgi:hypothetical protein
MKPAAPAGAEADARRRRLHDVLLDLLRTAFLPAWPGCDGMTTEEVVLHYPTAASAGRVPNLERLLCQHPDLADELRILFAAASPQPEPRS